MPLSKIDKEYFLPMISLIDAKTVELDRVITNLLPLLKYEGVPLARSRSELVTVPMLRDAVTRHDTLHFRGFAEHAEVVEAWIESDFLSLVRRGDPDKQRIAAPLPMHLNTYKLRNPAHCRDYGLSSQLFSLLYHGAPTVMNELRDYLWRGADYETDLYDGHTPLDIETLMMLRILDQQRRDEPDRRKPVQVPLPICLGQARLLGDDIERLLEYRNEVPRLVLIGYIKNIMALHSGIYLLRLFQIVPKLVSQLEHDPTCEHCHVTQEKQLSCRNCTNPVHILVDMGEKYLGVMPELARQQFENHLSQLNIYIRAHIALKKLHEYGQSLQSKRILGENDLKTIEQVSKLQLHRDRFEFRSFFDHRVTELLRSDDQERDENLAAIQRMQLDEFETYVEMLHLLRQRFWQKYYVESLDSVFQKNHENGLLRQGVGQKRNKRRYAMGSGLLETLVQIAVLRRAPNGDFRTRHIRIDEFLDWLETRYGIYISRLPEGTTPSITELEALRLNVQAFKQRLREIGFYTDLSDAFVAQIIRPRYTLETPENE